MLRLNFGLGIASLFAMIEIKRRGIRQERGTSEHEQTLSDQAEAENFSE